MRIGINPEKKKFKTIKYKQHRVIVPVYIPDTNDAYFENLFEVFKTSINSLLNTIDTDETNITIINNNSKDVVSNYIEKLVEQKKIDKHVSYQSNYGKVYTILSEARTVYEPLVTIADADVFYFTNWENSVIKVHNAFKKVGVVSPLPLPNLVFYNNKTLFTRKLYKIKKDKVISDLDLDLFSKSLGNDILKFKNESKFYKKQFYIKDNNNKYCIGASHFIATYKTSVLKSIKFKRPNFVFKNGDEEFFMDRPIDMLGFYRLSTINTYAYHLGNTLPDSIVNKVVTNSKQIEYNNYSISSFSMSINNLLYKLTSFSYRVIRFLLMKIHRNEK